MRPSTTVASALLFACVSIASDLRAQTPRFAELRAMFPDDIWSLGLTPLDVDGDGDLDLVVPRHFRNRLYRNDGNGVFTDVTAATLPVDSILTGAIVSADLDGDGDLDLYLANSGSNGAQDSVYLNDGTGVFTDVTAAVMPTAIDVTYAVALGDLDGDGDPDALRVTRGALKLYRNAGARFVDVTASSLPPSSSTPATAALGDVDGDGDLDAWIGNLTLTGQQDQLLLNDGTGTFTDVSATHLPGAASATAAVALADLDGDGDLDGLAAAAFNGLARIYRNDGTGRFTDVSAGNLPPIRDQSPGGIAVADFDGDGDPDTYFALLGDDRLLLNDGSGRFTDSPLGLPAAAGESSTGIAVADIDGDGDVDALVDAIRDSLFLNDGRGGLVDVMSTSPPQDRRATTGVALADLDRDGDLDALLSVSNLTLDQNRLLLNDGRGAFVEATASHLPAVPSTGMAVSLGDVDGDGDLDALFANAGVRFVGIIPERDTLWLNDGTGRFQDATRTHLPAVLDHTWDAVLADVDGDGDLDAVLANFQTTRQNRLYLNDGTGVFTDVTATAMPMRLDESRAVAAGDVDGDGDLDLLIGNAAQQNRLLRNDGAGVFTDVTNGSLPIDSDQTQDAALADLDGDGDLDVVIGNSRSQDRIYANDGAGVFTDVTHLSLPAHRGSTRTIAIGDVDGDGDLDVLAGDDIDVDNRLYLNDGAGRFTDASRTDLPETLSYAQAIALGDLDLDGDLDAYVGNRADPDQVYFNLRRQLAWRGVPRVGKPLDLSVRGQPTQCWFLFGATARRDIELLFGTLRLDPAGFLQLMSGGVLDGRGVGMAELSVPPHPSIIGQPVYWQAAITPPLELTNLEITVLTGL